MKKLSCGCIVDEKGKKDSASTVFSKKQNLKILKSLSERELEKVKETLVGISSDYQKRLKGVQNTS